MKLPNAQHAVIDPMKLRHYVLNAEHPDGTSKARFLALAGYSAWAWEELERDLRSQHLSKNIKRIRDSPYGQKYEISSPIVGPNGTSLMIRTVWIIPRGEVNPRLVTLIPEKQP